MRKWCEYQARHTLDFVKRIVGCGLLPFTLLAAMGFLILGATVIWVIVFNMPIDVNGKIMQRAEAAPIVLKMFAGFGGGLVLMVVLLRLWANVFTKYFVEPQVNMIARSPVPESPGSLLLECDFQFSVGGETFKRSEIAEMTGLLDDNPVEPVLYLPSNPRRARVVRTLSSPMQAYLVATQ